MAGNKDKHSANDDEKGPAPSNEVAVGIGYEITGRAAHARIAPLLPKEWIDCSPYAATGVPRVRPSVSFLWENAPRPDTKTYRDTVTCYSHLPNGTAILDDKWALARLLCHCNDDRALAPAVLESHCFQGPAGFQHFASLVGLFQDDNDDNDKKKEKVDEESPVQETAFPELVVTKDGDDNKRTRPPPAPKNLWVLKDATCNGAGGIWVVDSSNASQFAQIVRKDSEKTKKQSTRWVAQRYAWPPLLYHGRKFHVRVYALLTSGDGGFLCAHLHKRCFLHVANQPFAYHKGGTFCPSVHITNCCANSQDQTRFAGEIGADLTLAPGQDPTVIGLQPFFDSMAASVATLTERAQPFLSGGSANGGFEYLGLDFVLSYSSSGGAPTTPVAYLLEVNAPPSQDTATGLASAEELHNHVLADLISMWVLPRVTKGAISSRPGGWMRVHPAATTTTTTTTPEKEEEETNISNNNNTSKDNMLPSRAAILNKVHWAMWERKVRKSRNEQHDNVQSSNLRVAVPPPLWVTTTAVGDSPGILATTAKETRLDAWTKWVQSQYPYFATPSPIFFESAGGAQVPQHVVEEMQISLTRRHRNVIGRQSKRDASQVLLTLLGANAETHALFWGANATSLLHLLACSFRHVLQPHEEIVISTENHQAHVAPWMAVAQETGARIVWCQPDEWQSLLRPQTRIVALSHASNTLGEWRDLQRWSDAMNLSAKNQRRPYLIVDGVAAVPHVFANLRHAPCVDFYVVSCHKWFGPHLGALCGRQSSWESLGSPLLEYGTVNYEACAGVVGLGKYFAQLGAQWGLEEEEDRAVSTETHPLDDSTVQRAYEIVECLDARLLRPLWDYLQACPDIRLLQSPEAVGSAPSKRLPIVCFRHARYTSQHVVQHLAQEGIISRCGKFLSAPPFWQQHADFFSNNDENDGVVRLSLAHYNTLEEIKAVILALQKLS